eukprot:jgi/Ulvmu1/7659/UM038_0088.1
MVVAFTAHTGEHTWLPREESPLRQQFLAAQSHAAKGVKFSTGGWKSGRQTGQAKRLPSKIVRSNHFGKQASIKRHDSKDIVALLTDRMHTLRGLGSLDALKDDHIAHIKDRVKVSDDSIVQRVRAAQKSELLARQQLVHVYDEAAVSWAVAKSAATLIQCRWKGFIARRAFLRDRRKRWIAKRSESLRMHQDRRWKWMDAKDQILVRQPSPECVARAHSGAEEGLPHQASVQQGGPQRPEKLSPAWGGLLAGVITIKTLQRSMRARRQSVTQAVDTSTVPLQMPSLSDPVQATQPARLHAAVLGRLPAQTQHGRAVSADPQEAVLPHCSPHGIYVHEQFPSAAHALPPPAALAAIHSTSVDPASQAVSLGGQATAPMAAATIPPTSTSSRTRSRTATPQRARSRQRSRFQPLPSCDSPPLQLQPAAAAKAPPAEAALGVPPPRSPSPRRPLDAPQPQPSAAPAAAVLSSHARQGSGRSVGPCIGRSVQRGAPSLSSRPRARSSTDFHQIPRSGCSQQRRRPVTRGSRGATRACSGRQGGLRRAVSAPARSCSTLWHAEDLEVTGHAATAGINLAGYVGGAAHASLSPVARLRPQCTSPVATPAPRAPDKTCARTDVAPPQYAACESLLVVCDDDAAAGRATSAHRKRRADPAPASPMSTNPPEALVQAQLCGPKPHALFAPRPPSRGAAGLDLRDLARRALRSGHAAAEGSTQRRARSGRSLVERPVTAPGQIRTGRAPQTKEWASQRLADANFGSTGKAEFRRRPSREGRARGVKAAQGQLALQLNIQAAQAFERVARQSNPVVLWGSSGKVVH